MDKKIFFLDIFALIIKFVGENLTSLASYMSIQGIPDQRASKILKIGYFKV